MNLLQFKNRFKPSAFTPPNVNEIKGYMGALEDLLTYLQDVTAFDPSKRMIDSVSLLNAITETNAELGKKLKSVNLNSEKVQSFLKDQVAHQWSEVEREIEDEMNSKDDIKNVL